jgi:hypothetical protein
MPQNKNNQKPKVMTWAKASPVLVVAGIFDALRAFFEMFWFFGPALAAVACTAGVNSLVGTTVAATAGKAVAIVCSAVAGTAGYFGAPAIAAFGIVMAISVGLFGWLVVGSIMLTTNGRIFKENEANIFWFVGGLLISEVPIVGSFPALISITWKMYSTQIKKDKEVLKKYETEQKERVALQAQDRNQRIAEFVQASQAQYAQAEI